jgi:hypothetical protein
MPKQRVSAGLRSGSLRAIRDNPALPAFMRTLSSRALAQLCSRVGIGDAAEFMALAPAERLVKALDASVWKIPRPGSPEVFDPNELVEWLWVWLEIGEAFTAERLAAIPDVDLTLYLSRLLCVSTGDMWGFERSTEIEDYDRIYAPSLDETAYGPYVVNTIAHDHWEIVRAALDAMWRHGPERLLHLFAQLSADESMRTPDIDRDSANRDFVFDRDSSRERRGYVTTDGARAFLAIAETTPPEELLTMSHYDLETRRHLAAIEIDGENTDTDVDADEAPRDDGARLSSATAEDAALPALRIAFETAGLIEPPAGAPLLTHDSARDRLPIIKILAQLAHDDSKAFDMRSRELAYLASVLMTSATVNDEAMSGENAKEAALAMCNLGLEILRENGGDARIGSEPGLVRLFLVGWQVIGEVPGRVVDAFKRSLKELKAAMSLPAYDWLVQEAQGAYADLQAAFARRNFSAAREAVLMLSLVFEPRSSRAAAPLMDEVPRILAIPGGSARWIDSLADLRRVGELLDCIGVKEKR